MTLRHKRSVRIAALAWVLIAAWWFRDDQTPQRLLQLAMVGLLLAASLRALVSVRGETVYRRGLTGWDTRPVPLDELTAVSLRREATFRRFPLVLRLTGPDDAEVSIECWAWEGWRELAHRAGHFAEALGAQCDEVTARRMACKRSACPWASRAASIVGGRRADSPPDDDVGDMVLSESVAVVAALFAFGFAMGLLNAWFGDDRHASALFPAALGWGGVFAVVGLFTVLWDKVKGS